MLAVATLLYNSFKLRSLRMIVAERKDLAGGRQDLCLYSSKAKQISSVNLMQKRSSDLQAAVTCLVAFSTFLVTHPAELTLLTADSA